MELGKKDIDNNFEVAEFNGGNVDENHWDKAMQKVAGGMAATALAIGSLAAPQAAFAGDIESGE